MRRRGLWHARHVRLPHGWGSIAGVLLVLAAPACAHPGADSAHPGHTSSRPATAAPSPSWMMGVGPSDVTSIKISPDGRTLSIAVHVPTGTAEPCYRKLAGRINDFSAKSTIIGITADYRTDPACNKTKTVTVSVRLPKPLGARTVNVNSSSDGGYTTDPGTPGTLRFCYEFVCGHLPATCDGATIARIAHGADVQQPATWTVRGCDATGLVLDLSWTGGPACDNACPTLPTTSIRWFYRATPESWMALTATRTGGCAVVHAADPSFPTALCASLEPL